MFCAHDEDKGEEGSENGEEGAVDPPPVDTPPVDTPPVDPPPVDPPPGSPIDCTGEEGLA